MKKLSAKFDLSKVVIPLSTLTIVDPDTLKDEISGSYYSVGNEAAKRLAQISMMESLSFSRKLYKADADSWRYMMSRRQQQEEYQTNIGKYNAVTVSPQDSDIIMLSEGNTHITEVIDCINKFIEDPELETYCQIDNPSTMAVISVNRESHRGVLITYYMSANWITVTDCVCDINDESVTLIITPIEELSTYIDEDIPDMLDKDALMTSSEDLLDQNLEEYELKLSSTFMSVEDFVYYIKKIFKIRLEMRIPNVIEYATKHEEYSEFEISLLSKLLNEFYSNTSLARAVHAPYLHRAITFTDITYQEFSELLKIMVFRDTLSVEFLRKFYEHALSNHTNYDEVQMFKK